MHSPPSHEIERTYLLDRLPDLPAGAAALRIEQGYLPGEETLNSDEEDLRGRIRRETHPDGTVRCTNTIKRGSGLVRQEFEREITQEQFERHWPRTRGARLSKTRHLVREGQLVWEVDQFHDLELVLADVELPAPDASAPLPGWLAPHVVREVTDEPAYRNYRIALRVHEAQSAERRHT